MTLEECWEKYQEHGVLLDRDSLYYFGNEFVFDMAADCWQAIKEHFTPDVDNSSGRAENNGGK